MSSWQSFFNQLSRPVNKEIIVASEKICSCNIGYLQFSGNSYQHKGGCCLTSACCVIQIDKHRARINSLYRSKSENTIPENCSSQVYSLDTFLKT